RTAHGAALRSLCDGHHEKAFSIGAFLTAPALAGIGSDLMQSQGATDHCRRRPIENAETTYEIRLGEWQDTPPAIFLCGVLEANGGELPARTYNAALLLRSRVLCR